jgi:hypothetical protein
MIEELKVIANKRDVPYQSLLKIFISERIDAELHHFDHRARLVKVRGELEDEIMAKIDAALKIVFDLA